MSRMYLLAVILISLDGGEAMICPCCSGETDQQTHDGVPLVCNPCMEAQIEQEILANTVQLISQACAGKVVSDGVS